MSEATCDRAWSAEAMEDGRLTGDARAEFLEHAEHCPVCANELRDLVALRVITRGLPPLVAEPGPIRRSRVEILRRAGELRAPSAAARRHAYLMFAAAIAAIVAFVVERNLLRRPAETPASSRPASGAAPTFEVANIDGAVWESKVDGATARSLLTRGVAAFHVDRLGPGQRFILALPDGEIEVHGTRFVVAIERGATRSVDVSEGVVALRLPGRGLGEVMLKAGERWSTGSPATSATTPERSSASADEEARPAVSAQSGNVPMPGEQRDATGSATVSSPAPGAAPRDETAAQRFSLAASAFQSGAYARADALLAAFERDFPRDPHGEDVAFLRATAHARMGDSAGAAALARAYLRAYPKGLRRREAERIAGE